MKHVPSNNQRAPGYGAVHQLRLVFFITLMSFGVALWGQSTVILFDSNPALESTAGIAGNVGVSFGSVGTGAPFASTVGCGNEYIANNWTAGGYWVTGSFNTTAHAALTLSYQQSNFPSGPGGNKQLQYSLNNATWINIGGTYTLPVTEGCDAYTVVDMPLPAALENQPAVYLRWVNLTGTSGTGQGSRIRVIEVKGIGPDGDACPDDPDKTAPGQCGCGVPDTDTDGDGIADCNDPDDDNDQVPDGDDSHPLDNTQCRDADGDTCDDCSSGTDAPNNDGSDNDGDGQCDAGDPDDDNDGVVDGDDSHPFDNTRCRDVDGDTCDDCSSGTDAPNNDGPDYDSDGLCDAGDPDDDNDGVLDGDDDCAQGDLGWTSDNSTDNDGDGCQDAGEDTDDDNDGVLDVDDNCQFDANPGQEDLDQDMIGDVCDPIVNVGGAGTTLIDMVNATGANNGQKNALNAKVNAAIASCAAGNSGAAVNQLNAFINQVNALRGKSLTDAEADALIAVAQTIIDAINNGLADCGAPRAMAPSSQPWLPSQAPHVVAKESDAVLPGAVMRSYPNPIGETLTVELQLSRKAKVEVAVINLVGQRLATLTDGVLEAGLHVLQWDARTVQRGSYFLVTSIDGLTQSELIGIIK